MHSQKQRQDKEITQLPELQLPSALRSLSTLVTSTRDFYMSTTCVTHTHPNMSEHIKLTQTRYSQFLVVEHGLKTSKDSSHQQVPLLILNYSLHVHYVLIISHSSPNNQDTSTLPKSITEKLKAGYFSKLSIISTSVKNCTRIDCNSILTAVKV